MYIEFQGINEWALDRKHEYMMWQMYASCQLHVCDLHIKPTIDRTTFGLMSAVDTFSVLYSIKKKIIFTIAVFYLGIQASTIHSFMDFQRISQWKSFG